MKKAVTLLLALLGGLVLFSGKASAQVGVSGSFINSSLYDSAGSARPGFSGAQADLTWNIAFNRFLGVNLGAGYIYLNRKEDPKVVGGNAAECFSREHHLRIPLHLTLNIPLTPTFGFVLFAGATGTYALSGSNNLRIKLEDGSTGLLTYDYFSGVEGRNGLTDSQYAVALPSLDKSPQMVRYDAQVEAGIGVRISPVVMVRGGYSYGFINRYKDPAQGFLRRNQIHAGITLLF